MALYHRWRHIAVNIYFITEWSPARTPTVVRLRSTSYRRSAARTLHTPPGWSMQNWRWGGWPALLLHSTLRSLCLWDSWHVHSPTCHLGPVLWLQPAAAQAVQPAVCSHLQEMIKTKTNKQKKQNTQLTETWQNQTMMHSVMCWWALLSPQSKDNWYLTVQCFPGSSAAGQYQS